MSPRRSRSRIAALCAVAALAATACGASGGSTAGEQRDASSSTALTNTASPTTVAAAKSVAAVTTAAPAAEPIDPANTIPAGAVTDLESALYDPDQQRPAVAPLRVSIPAIKVRDAPIVGVGVVPEGDLEVPDGKTVGWYRFGSAPGEDGSTVLAAHVAFDGANGVFRYLTKLRAGDTIDVVDADGTDRSYSVSSVEQFPKTGLPADRVWRRDGPSQLVLLTCGGSFNSAIRHYEDNVVVFATPIT